MSKTSTQEQDQEKNLSSILCPFCSTPWNDQMLKVYDISSYGGCDTCGYGATKHATLQITCCNPSCSRIIYQKDYTIRD